MMALPESGSTPPPIYAPWRWRQGHLRPDCERLYITSATPGRSRDTAHHAGAVHSPWAARPTGRMAGYRCACREGGPRAARLPASRRQQIQRTRHYCFRMLVATTRLKMDPEQSTRSYPTRLSTPFVMRPLPEVGEVTLTHELPMAFSSSIST